MKLNDKVSAFLNGAGFYIVLLLAIAIIGASGYFIYSNLIGNRDTPRDPAAASNEVPLSQQPEHETPDTPPADETVSPNPSEERESLAVSGTTEITAEAAAPAEAEDTRVLSPLEGETVTAFSMDALLYNETMGDWRTHDGIDIAAAEGTQVTAAASGTVSSVTEDYWMGTTVVVSCADGYELTYASLQGTPAVSAGDEVRSGDPIGIVGTTALLEENCGPHLHFSVYQDGSAVDPVSFLSGAS